VYSFRSMAGWYWGLPWVVGLVLVNPSCFRFNEFMNASMSRVGFSWVM
jgi:hypothetical protein